MQTVAYLGPARTNTHVAARKRFGRKARYVHAPTVDEVFHVVERRQADYGVVPVENSLEGAVTHTLDRFIDFMDTPIKIHGEIEQPIRHYLILHRQTALSGVKVVFSHPQAFTQCRRWLEQRLPHALQLERHSTAEAVECVLHGRVSAVSTFLDAWKSDERAAVGRRELATTHRLRAIPIPEERDNKTRFLVLGLGEPRRGRRNKTAIVFALKDKPGALHDALVPFKRHRINLTKIESRPSKRKAWEYLFFIDFEGHASQRNVGLALEVLRRSASALRVLGSYPVAG